MTPNTFLWIAAISMAIAVLTSLGSRLLVDFSRRELDVYCRRHLLGARFAHIMGAHDRVVLAVDSLKTIAFAFALPSGSFWLIQEVESLPPGRFFLILGGVAVAMLLAVNWVPAALVKLWSAPLLARTWPLWIVVEFVMYPLMVIVALVESVLRRAGGKGEQTDEDEEEAFEDEIRAIVTSGLREGYMEEDAREMIEGVMDLGDDVAVNIMTPRSEVDALECSVDWSEMLRFLNEVRRTRVPVYRESLDNIIGVLYVKDLLLEMARKPEERKTLPQIARDPWFVPDSIPLDELLQEFLKNRKHLAVVADEYGAVAGVVTIEDVLEEIVGEILDESDLEEEPEEFRVIDARVTEVLGRAQIEDVNDRLGLAIPESDIYDTLGGFVIAKLGYIPEVGERIEENGYELLVTGADRRRVATIRVTRLTSERETA